jgi:hypothetical protein
MTYYGGEVPDEGTPVSVEYTDGDILWDDTSPMLWDDGSDIEWSHHTDTSPDVYHNFSTPRITYAGEAE